MKARFAVFAACWLVAVLAVQTASAASGATPRTPAARKATKLDGRLAAVVRAQATGRGVETARSLGLDVKSGAVRVVAVAASGVGAVESAATAAGGEVEATHAGLVQALVPPSGLEALARSGAVARVRAPHEPFADAVTGQEIALSGVDSFQAAFWNGTGVKVAVIDAGFAGLATRQAEGDIPGGVVTQDMCGGGFSTASVHGAGVAEIVHEVAPQAQLHLICVNSEVTLGQAKEYVKANNIPIVNMSLAFLNAGRGDGTGGPGTVDGIVADARANGVLWVNSAGNYQQRHWSGTFNGPLSRGSLHSFAGGDARNTIVLGNGQQACVFLKWDQWPTSNQDYDLYLVRESDGADVAASEGAQTGSQEPAEGFCYTNPGATGNFGIEIMVWEASQTPRFDMIATFPNLEYRVTAGSLAEPASSPNAMAVGALCWFDRSLRSYSSLGPTIDGRTKPDIAGLDGMSNGTYGTSSNCSGGFTGTSASSPHVAGLAALAKHQNPALTPAQLQTWLEARAQDAGAPGKDNSFGWGRAWVHTFTDTPAYTGLAPQVELLFKKGTTGGCSPLDVATGARLYCPESSVTRDQMAVFIVRSLNLSPLTPPSPTFQDVPASYWAFGEIERLAQQGITGGCQSTPVALFCPTQTVRRDQMAAFLYRARGFSPLSPPPSPPTFQDVPASYWAFNEIEKLYEQAITGGCQTGPPRLYCPADLVTRRSMAAFLIRTFGPPTP